ncbi:hypothetical protein EJB05_49862, partial [Eragrostis curvula]
MELLQLAVRNQQRTHRLTRKDDKLVDAMHHGLVAVSNSSNLIDLPDPFASVLSIASCQGFLHLSTVVVCQKACGSEVCCRLLYAVVLGGDQCLRFPTLEQVLLCGGLFVKAARFTTSVGQCLLNQAEKAAFDKVEIKKEEKEAAKAGDDEDDDLDGNTAREAPAV